MSAHGRNAAEDFSPLVHHSAPKGARLTTRQRADNRAYNAAVNAREEMLRDLAQGKSLAYMGKAKPPRSVVRARKQAKK